MRKQYIEVSLPLVSSVGLKMWRAVLGMILLPGYLIAASMSNAPGISLHIQCAILALRLVTLSRISLRKAFSLIYFPMDSTRYFEFQATLSQLKKPFARILDVSSPRILPLMLLRRQKLATVEMLNPDIGDLRESIRFADSLGLADRCTFTHSTVDGVDSGRELFDLITCISVLEHIPADEIAIKKMWSLLRPGGTLLLTVPCTAQSYEQYISRNDYGILSPETDGYTYWQRFYDEDRLDRVIFSVTGMPRISIVYGEKGPGLFFRNASMKRLLGARYPFWREAYMMAKEYRYFRTIGQLPGEGVTMMEFEKPNKISGAHQSHS